MKFLLYIGLLFSMHLSAFQTTNIQLLYSDKFDGDAFIYDTTSERKTTLTLEHYRTWSYGDLYMFADIMSGKKFDNTSTGIYSEIAPRFSFSKMLGKDLSNDLIADVYIATQVNLGRSYDAYLYGLGVDFKVPLFNFFSINAYNKEENINSVKQKDTYQVTTVYITKSFYKMHFEGFMDVTRRDINTQNQFLYAIDSKEKAFVGVEWLYYYYNYAQSTAKTSVIQAMIKYKF